MAAGSLPRERSDAQGAPVRNEVETLVKTGGRGSEGVQTKDLSPVTYVVVYCNRLLISNVGLHTSQPSLVNGLLSEVGHWVTNLEGH